MPKIRVVIRRAVTFLHEAVYEDDLSEEVAHLFKRGEPDASVWAQYSLAPSIANDKWKPIRTFSGPAYEVLELTIDGKVIP